MTPAMWEMVANYGVAALVIVIVAWLVLTGRLRLGREYTTLERDRDFWRDASLRGLSASTTAINVAERLAPVARERVSE